jgi:peptidoglycan/xylan/chitin deacetylase (PgdA/CDA1 family)
LTYHSIGARDHEMNVKPAAFRDQMRWLADHTHAIAMDEAVNGAEGVAITFDDGFRDNIDNALPVLDELELPAVIFVVAGIMGAPFPSEAALNRAPLMTWDDARAAESAGVIIGGHSLTHARLSSLSDADQRREIGECARLLREELGERLRGFAYPYGSLLDYNEVSMQAAKEAGFEYACSNRYGWNGATSDRWALRRIWIDRTDTLKSFAAKVEGRLDALALMDSAAGIRARRILNATLGVR